MADRSIELGGQFLDAKAEAALGGTRPSEADAERLILEARGWPRLKYELERTTLATKLNVRLTALDEMVRPPEAPANDAGPFSEVTPSSEPQDGGRLLDDVMARMGRYIAFDPPQAILSALWVVVTYLVEQATVLPMLAITAPAKGCGKTTMLGVLLRLVKRAIPASNISTAALFRVVDKLRPCLLIDEWDTFGDNPDMRGVINSGHTPDTAYVWRCDGEDNEPRQFMTFCPKAIAGIGRPADTIMARSIEIALRRKYAGESVESLRHADTAPFDELRARLTRWALDNAAKFAAARPSIPEQLQNRVGDNAEPLLAIAGIAGGDWPERTRAALLLQLAATDDDSLGVGEELLGDVRRAFRHREQLQPGQTRISTDHLLRFLNARDEAPWSTHSRGKPMTANDLARLLRKFGIRPGQLRIDGPLARGYQLSQFTDAFTRYLAPDDATP